MGAWGHGSFENDNALDWVFGLTEKGGDISSVEQALDVVPGLEVDADEGSEALAAAEVVAALMGKGRDCLPEELVAWISGLESVDLEPLRVNALKAVDAVLSEDSELRYLWAESKDFEVWKADVTALRAVLEK